MRGHASSALFTRVEARILNSQEVPRVESHTGRKSKNSFVLPCGLMCYRTRVALSKKWWRGGKVGKSEFGRARRRCARTFFALVVFPPCSSSPSPPLYRPHLIKRTSLLSILVTVLSAALPSCARMGSDWDRLCGTLPFSNCPGCSPLSAQPPHLPSSLNPPPNLPNSTQPWSLPRSPLPRPPPRSLPTRPSST